MEVTQYELFTLLREKREEADRKAETKKAAKQADKAKKQAAKVQLMNEDELQAYKNKQAQSEAQRQAKAEKGSKAVIKAVTKAAAKVAKEEEKAAQAAEKAEKDARKSKEKAEKVAVKAAEKAEKDADKAEKDAAKAKEKVEKDAAKADEKAKKDAAKAAEKAENDACKANEKAEKDARKKATNTSQSAPRAPHTDDLEEVYVCEELDMAGANLLLCQCGKNHVFGGGRCIDCTASEKVKCVVCNTRIGKTEKEQGHWVRGKRCGKCFFVVYCGTECQTEHWPVHQKECFSEECMRSFLSDSKHNR